MITVPPSAPVVGITSTGSSWVFLQWSIVDTGGTAVRGFIINYRQQEQGEWEERPVSRDLTSYRLKGLTCGIEYHVQVENNNVKLITCLLICRAFSTSHHIIFLILCRLKSLFYPP